MKSFKIILLCLFISILTGCTASDTIIIKKDNRIEEDIRFIENNGIILNYAPDIDSYIRTSMAQIKKTQLIKQNYFKDIKGKNRSGELSIAVYKDFSGFEQDTPLKGQIFDNLTMSTNGNIVSIKFDSISKPYGVLNTTGEDKPLLDKFIIGIKLPYEVISHNADRIDKINNTYYWDYNKLTVYKDVDISYNNGRIYHSTIFDRIVDAYHKGYLTAPVAISVFLIVVLGITFIVKNNNSNINKI